MKIESIEINKLVENDWNPNFMSDSEFASLVRQIKKHGMRQPILVRQKGGLLSKKFQIIDGAHRCRASKEAGLNSIDCVIVDIDEARAKTATIAMNKIRGTVDDLSLAKLLESLKHDLKSDEISELSGIEEKRVEVLIKLLDMPQDLSKLAGSSSDGEITITFILTPTHRLLLEKTLSKIDKKNKAFALVRLCNFYNKNAPEKLK